MTTITNERSYQTSFNRELILDLSLQAFFIYDLDHSIDSEAPRIHDYVPVSSAVKENEDFDVFDENGVLVVDALGAQVTVTGKVTGNRSADSRRERFKYLVSQGTDFTVGEYNNYGFEDWGSYSGGAFDFSSYLITGYNISGDFMRKKQTTYLNVLCDRTETVYNLVSGSVVLARQSSCLVQAQWDWNSSVDQGKWGTQFEAYRLFLPTTNNTPASGDTFNYGARVIETKNKLRGSGKSLSVYFQSTAGKDMKLLGWGVLGYKGDTP